MLKKLDGIVTHFPGVYTTAFSTGRSGRTRAIYLIHGSITSAKLLFAVTYLEF